MEKLLTTERFFSLFPHWYIAACFITGFVVFPIICGYFLRPIMRGTSHGLYEVVLYWKAGVPMWGMFKRVLKLIFIDVLFWGVMNSSVTKTSIGPASWYGIFGWYYEKSFTRANSKRAANNKAVAKTEPATEEEPFELDDDK